jgi:hypothetical protein
LRGMLQGTGQSDFRRDCRRREAQSGMASL